MSVFAGVRLPDELAASVDEEARNRGKNRSQIIIEAVMEHQRRGGVQVSAIDVEENAAIIDEVLSKAEREKMITEKPARAKKEKPVEIPKAPESAKEPEEPAVSGGCRKHPAVGGWPKAGGWWCLTCGKIV
jgi:predicted transcriptional regulator